MQIKTSSRPFKSIQPRTTVHSSRLESRVQALRLQSTDQDYRTVVKNQNSQFRTRKLYVVRKQEDTVQNQKTVVRNQVYTEQDQKQ
jgi:hypothetical protein